MILKRILKRAIFVQHSRVQQIIFKALTITVINKALSPVLKKVWCEYEYEYGLGVSMVWGVVFPGP